MTDIPFTHENLGEGDEGDFTRLTPERGYSRYIDATQHADPQWGSQWWGAATHQRPSNESGPDA